MPAPQQKHRYDKTARPTKSCLKSSREAKKEPEQNFATEDISSDDEQYPRKAQNHNRFDALRKRK